MKGFKRLNAVQKEHTHGKHIGHDLEEAEKLFVGLARWPHQARVLSMKPNLELVGGDKVGCREETHKAETWR